MSGLTDSGGILLKIQNTSVFCNVRFSFKLPSNKNNFLHLRKQKQNKTKKNQNVKQKLQCNFYIKEMLVKYKKYKKSVIFDVSKTN